MRDLRNISSAIFRKPFKLKKSRTILRKHKYCELPRSNHVELTVSENQNPRPQSFDDPLPLNCSTQSSPQHKPLLETNHPNTRKIQLTEEEKSMNGAPEGDIFDLTVKLSTELEPLCHLETVDTQLNEFATELQQTKEWATQFYCVENLRRCVQFSPATISTTSAMKALDCSLSSIESLRSCTVRNGLFLLNSLIALTFPSDPSSILLHPPSIQRILFILLPKACSGPRFLCEAMSSSLDSLLSIVLALPCPSPLDNSILETHNRPQSSNTHPHPISIFCHSLMPLIRTHRSVEVVSLACRLLAQASLNLPVEPFLLMIQNISRNEQSSSTTSSTQDIASQDDGSRTGLCPSLSLCELLSGLQKGLVSRKAGTKEQAKKAVSHLRSLFDSLISSSSSSDTLSLSIIGPRSFEELVRSVLPPLLAESVIFESRPLLPTPTYPSILVFVSPSLSTHGPVPGLPQQQPPSPVIRISNISSDLTIPSHSTLMESQSHSIPTSTPLPQSSISPPLPLPLPPPSLSTSTPIELPSSTLPTRSLVPSSLSSKPSSSLSLALSASRSGFSAFLASKKIPSSSLPPSSLSSSTVIVTKTNPQSKQPFRPNNNALLAQRAGPRPDLKNTNSDFEIFCDEAPDPSPIPSPSPSQSNIEDTSPPLTTAPPLAPLPPLTLPSDSLLPPWKRKRPIISNNPNPNIIPSDPHVMIIEKKRSLPSIPTTNTTPSSPSPSSSFITNIPSQENISPENPTTTSSKSRPITLQPSLTCEPQKESRKTLLLPSTTILTHPHISNQITL